MKALDIAVFLWILQGSLFIVGSVFFGVNYVSRPEEIVSMEALQYFMDPNNMLDNAMKIGVVTVAGIAIAVLSFKATSGNLVMSLIALMGIAVTFTFLGRIIYYTLMLGEHVSIIISQSTNGIATLHSSVVWVLDGISLIINFMAVAEVWRGISLKQLS